MKFVSVCSGKGGVGKTALACSAAAILARDEKKVLLFDANLGLPNCDLYTGTDLGCTIGHVVRDKREIRDAIIQTSAGFDLISGGSGWPELALLSAEGVASLISTVVSLGSGYDHVLFDLPAGIGPRVFPFLEASDAAMLITDGSAVSLMDGYALVRTAWEVAPKLSIGVVVNRCASHGAGLKVADQFKAIVGQFLSREIRHWASVREDSGVGRCCAQRQVFAESLPFSAASQDLIDAVNVIEGGTEEPAVQVSMLERLKSKFGSNEEAA